MTDSGLGLSVAISGGTVVLGADLATVNANLFQRCGICILPDPTRREIITL
jgi:hypothetical protein